MEDGVMRKGQLDYDIVNILLLGAMIFAVFMLVKLVWQNEMHNDIQLRYTLEDGTVLDGCYDNNNAICYTITCPHDIQYSCLKNVKSEPLGFKD